MRDRENLRPSRYPWLKPHCMQYRYNILSLSVFEVLLVVTSLLMVLVTKMVLDAAVEGKSSYFTRYAILLLVLVIAQLIVKIAYLRQQEKNRIDIMHDLRLKFLQTISEKRVKDLSPYHSGELSTYLYSDLTIITEGIITIIPSIVSMSLKLIGAIAMLLVFNVQFTLALLFFGSLFVLFSVQLRKKFKALHMEVQRQDGKVRSYLQESLSSLIYFKVFGLNERMLEENSRRHQVLKNILMKRNTLTLFGHGGHQFIFQAGYMGAIIWGARGIYTDQMTIGTFTAILQLLMQVQAPLTKISGIMPRIYNTLGSAERVEEIAAISEEPKEEVGCREEFRGILIDHVSFSYGEVPVLRNFSTEIKKGEFIAVTGQSGGGKTTLLMLLLGAYEVQKGVIRMMFGDSELKPSASLRTLFAYVPQGNILFSGTVRENIIMFNKSASEEEFQDAVACACVEEFIDTLPQGYNTMIGENGYGISEGQAQRISIARALVAKREVLLLDEATSALDEVTENTLLKNLQKISGLTCIFVTHKREGVRICNKEIRFENGVALIQENKIGE